MATASRYSLRSQVADEVVWERVDLNDEDAVRERLRAVRVLIIGCGGLGSNVAHMLVRSGVGGLTIVDADSIERSNLNRQLYFLDQLGRPKVDVTREQLLRIDPAVDIETICRRIGAEEVFAIGESHDVIIEAVDDPVFKMELMHATALRDAPAPLVFGSGLAGVGPANEVRTELLGDGMYVCGDLTSDVRRHPVLMSPRVMITAAHQALCAVRIVLGHPETGE